MDFLMIPPTTLCNSSSENAGFVTEGTCSPRYNTGMAIFRCSCRKLVKFCENFVSRGWQRLVIFAVVRVVELVKILEKKLVG